MDKTLSKIRQGIIDAEPFLEMFTDDSIQPPVSDCEKLQAHLVKLQECLSVYKHYMQERELSPSFHLHAKINEASSGMTEEKDKEGSKTLYEQQEKEIQGEKKSLPPLSIGINDKFRFINELFKQNAAEYNIAVEQLNSLVSWQETEIYLNSLKMIYNWKDGSEVLDLLYSTAKKRYL